MIKNIEMFFAENPETPPKTTEFTTYEDRKYHWNKRINKAHEQSQIEPVQYMQVLEYVNEFLTCLEEKNGGAGKRKQIDTELYSDKELYLDNKKQTIINKGILAKECKWIVPVWDAIMKKYSKWEPKYCVIKNKFGLSHTKNIIWLKFTRKGYLGVVAKGMDINFSYDNSAGKLVKEVKDDWDESFVLIFPLTDLILDKRKTGEIERAIGEYLISKGVPIIDFYSHNY